MEGGGRSNLFLGLNHILGSVSIFNPNLFLNTEIVEKQISFYIGETMTCLCLLNQSDLRRSAVLLAATQH